MKEKKLKYSICIDAVFMHEKISFAEAMKKVADLGFEAVEFWSWWDKDIVQIRKCMDKTGLKIAAFCTKFINPGEEFLREEYLKGVRESIAAARRLNCNTLIAQAGWEFDSFSKGITKAKHRESLIETMKRAGELAVSENVNLVIEPLNLLVNHPGYHLSTSEDAFNLVSQIDCPNVKILFDIYHQQITEGNLIRNIIPNIEKIGHFHAAGNPGRGELAEGEIHYPNVLKSIAKCGYKGYIGLEYMTAEDPVPGLERAVRDILV
ncbi:MAG: TIM barrel protein [Eubacteriales bacterium]|nr:TIM barrel protein [Eubacteriales bacterium]